jgi:hypothetical protein
MTRKMMVCQNNVAALHLSKWTMEKSGRIMLSTSICLIRLKDILGMSMEYGAATSMNFFKKFCLEGKAVRFTARTNDEKRYH